MPRVNIPFENDRNILQYLSVVYKTQTLERETQGGGEGVGNHFKIFAFPLPGKIVYIIFSGGNFGRRSEDEEVEIQQRRERELGGVGREDRVGDAAGRDAGAEACRKIRYSGAGSQASCRLRHVPLRDLHQIAGDFR